MRLMQENSKILQRAVVGMDFGVAGDVVAVVLQRRRIERQKPERRDAQIVQIIQLLREPLKVTDAVGVAVGKRPDMELINDRALIPKRIVVEGEVFRVFLWPLHSRHMK